MKAIVSSGQRMRWSVVPAVLEHDQRRDAQEERRRERREQDGRAGGREPVEGEARRLGALGLVGGVVHPGAIDRVDSRPDARGRPSDGAPAPRTPATAPRAAAARRASRGRSPRRPVRHSGTPCVGPIPHTVTNTDRNTHGIHARTSSARGDRLAPRATGAGAAPALAGNPTSRPASTTCRRARGSQATPGRP